MVRKIVLKVLFQEQALRTVLINSGARNSVPKILSPPPKKKKTRALAHYHHFIDAFARSLAAVINTLDPHAIVIGGGLSNVASLYDDLPSVIKKYIFSSDCRTTLLKAKFGDSSGVRGAAWLPILQINQQI